MGLVSQRVLLHIPCQHSISQRILLRHFAKKDKILMFPFHYSNSYNKKTPFLGKSEKRV